jgi:hypothetical protein
MRFARAAVAAVLLGAWLAGALTASQRSASAMAGAATAFLDSLSPELRQQAALPLEGDEPARWNFIPNEMFPRKGLMFKMMSEGQRKLAHDLLKTGLSQKGYLTAAAIMDLENVLHALENGGRFARDPEQYYVTVFGAPAAKSIWGWRVEGHHVSLHFTVDNASLVASSPSFFGSNPAEVREGPKKGLRILAAAEDAGRALVLALDESQRKTAIIQDAAPAEIVTNNKVAIDPLSPVGIAAAALTPAERELLMHVIEAYTSMMADDVAAERMSTLRKAGIEKIAFAWAGETERGKKHYYRVQGPTFLVEFDNAQNDGNHIHSVWRDFNGDFGRDLLREHVRAMH